MSKRSLLSQDLSKVMTNLKFSVKALCLEQLSQATSSWKWPTNLSILGGFMYSFPQLNKFSYAASIQTYLVILNDV